MRSNQARALIGAAVAFSLVVLGAPALAQETPGSLAWITYWTIEPHQSQAFEAALAKHNEWHVQQNDPRPLHTWEIVTGKMTGHYIRGALGRSWADLDSPGYDEAADGADMRATVNPHVAKSHVVVYRVMPEVSRFDMSGPAAFIRVIHFKIKPGHQGTFMEAIKKIHEGIGKTSWPTQYIWHEVVDGGHMPTYALGLPRENWAGFAPPEKPFETMMTEAFGPEETGRIMTMITDAIEDQWSFTAAHRPDLSYMPASN